MLELQLVGQKQTPHDLFDEHEKKFHALADKKRLHILYELCQRGKVCVCDLTEILGMPQSKISYHLKILLDANLIRRDIHGTWSYYEVNSEEVNGLLSEQLCCVYRPEGGCC